MKKLLLLAVAVGAAALAPRAQAGISFGISIGPRYAPPPVYVAPAICAPAPRIIVPPPIVVAPPVYYPAPVYYAPPPRVVVYSHHGYGRHYRPHHYQYRHCH